MRLVDAILRQGHLSEQAIVEAIMTGDRPAHLDRCDLCAERALSLGRALESVRSAAIDAADAAFPAERLAAQQSQILRRLEQLDAPTRVIAFPNQARVDNRTSSRRRVAPGWIGVGTAAGLIIGAIGGQVTARLDPQIDRQPVVAAPAVTPASAPASPTPAQAPRSDAAAVNASVLEMDADAVTPFMPDILGAMNDATPRLILARQ